MKKKRSRAGLLLWLLGAVVVVLGVRFSTDRYYRMAYPVQYQEIVERYCAEFSVEPALCYAVIRTESSFDPTATSSIGARGLMQLTEETFDWVKSRLEPQADTTYDAMYEPEKNIEYGAYLLSALSERFGSVNNTLCAYHAGWGSAAGWPGRSGVFRRWGNTHNSVPGYCPICGKSPAYLSNLSRALW